jgi:hypothetical protein
MRVSRDIAADRVGTGYAVISPGTEWDPSAKGVRDIIVETDPKDGSHYAVVPDAALDEGGIFTLGLKLKHR